MAVFRKTKKFDRVGNRFKLCYAFSFFSLYAFVYAYVLVCAHSCVLARVVLKTESRALHMIGKGCATDLHF